MDIKVLCFEKFRQYNIIRYSFIDMISNSIIPNRLFDCNIGGIVILPYLYHLLLIICTVLIIISIFITNHHISLFHLHPIFISIGVLIFIAEGITSYRNHHLLDLLSPIMQHNKLTKSRAIHNALQCIGSIFISLGILFIIAYKFEDKKTIIPSSIHSIISTLTLVVISYQVASGLEKLKQLENFNKKYHIWHSDIGICVWDLLILSIITGLISYLHFTFLKCLILLLVFIIWYSVHIQVRSSNYKVMKAHEDDSINTDDSSSLIIIPNSISSSALSLNDNANQQGNSLQRQGFDDFEYEDNNFDNSRGLNA